MIPIGHDAPFLRLAVRVAAVIDEARLVAPVARIDERVLVELEHVEVGLPIEIIYARLVYRFHNTMST